jgi:SAM-dependent methyltransferase
VTDAPVPNRDSVEIATRHFYWKPVYAFLRVFELEAFADSGVHLVPPVLDLGSGNGTFARMLRERGVLTGVQVAADAVAERLAGAGDVAAWGAVRADLRRLPFRAGAFASIVSNAVVCCLPTDAAEDVDRALAEAQRVLAPGGVFALSVATAQYNRNLPLPELYRRLGAAGAARRYLERLDRGLEHYQVYEEPRWLAAVENAGLRVERVVHYFTPRQAACWNLLTLQGFRVFALAKLARRRWARRLASRAQAALFRPILERERRVPVERRAHRAGYILVVARKPGAESLRQVLAEEAQPAAAGGSSRGVGSGPAADGRIEGRRPGT